ncbi:MULTISPECIES: fumarate hydratase [Fusobacterium]|jgi:fumarate hydratase subunit alpha|uniref:Hydrolyase, tartrate alpha subunit/fumarate domain-containing protein, Fe-S type n=1 Tax=Fusobacterium ulcerans 12-1B TaxID=457404 RepID=H1PTK9_9FUSO|nr:MULTISPECIES: fumarate hydratase [Fusobacterium]EHO80885.1 hydrolyase, tartrate alpha subunit/fumarate domain-containing protein, Fe-S type [Fusobacterium ulcerans 12-1B]MDH6457058.1 fumarate hydratase subunit alpha [Fusobacterium sp. PH5-7]RGY60480.1 fumarate hydratase [Fusobacterium ulcerans]HJH07285.1 fumarate hydratase [Fusobacterium ulcerans]
MKELDLRKVTDEVERMCIEGNYFIGKEVLDKIKEAYAKEESEVGKNILGQIIENDEIAANEQVPMCQDTGIVVVFLEIGTEVKITGDIYEAVNEGIRRGYEKGYLRKSVVKDPLDRVNTKDNSPAVIHTTLVPGSDKVKIIVAPKGGGSENMSVLRMLKPSDGIEGIKKLVIETIKNAGGNPCPPIIVGIGIGGNFEKCAILAKEALMRDINDKSSSPINAKLEEELLELINKTGVGPLGLGGRTTALAVKVETYPCHIAALPVAINLNCHAARHKEVEL